MKQTQQKKTFIDQMGYKVDIPWPPQRIVSLVPSQTELLFSLDLDKEVVGITKFCIHPDSWYRTKQRVGGTKNVNIAQVEALKPDLIIGNKEENKEEQIKELMQRYPVWMSDIHNLDDAIGMISNVGNIVDKSDKANELVNRILSNFKKLINHEPASGKVAYFIWKNPYMSVSKQTFINYILEEVCKLENVFAGARSDYPEVTAAEIKNAAPELILLSSEPYPFAEKHIKEFGEICPAAKVLLVDGEYFSWYGSRLKDTPAYLSGILKQINNG